MIRHLAGGAALLAGLALAPNAHAAEKFPSRAITLINVFSPGGPIDTHFRVLATQVEKTLGVPVVVDSKPGGGGTLGPATMAATAKPDGYTLSYVGTAVFAVPAMQKVSFDPLKDFTYVINLAGYRLIVVVGKDSRWQTWAELAAEAKANPGKVSYSSTGPGGATQLSFEVPLVALGLKFNHVPFRGASEQITAFLGNHVDVTPIGGAILPFVETGQARPVLWLTAQPGPRLPDVPGLDAIGVKPAIDTTFPYGLAGPKGMDPKVVKILHDALKKAIETPENAKVLAQLDQVDRYMSTADYTASVQKQVPAYRKLLGDLGLAKAD